MGLVNEVLREKRKCKYKELKGAPEAIERLVIPVVIKPFALSIKTCFFNNYILWTS